MANLVEVKVPDIGDFTAIPVIEILVKVGDTISVRGTLQIRPWKNKEGLEKLEFEIPFAEALVTHKPKEAKGEGADAASFPPGF